MGLLHAYMFMALSSIGPAPEVIPAAVEFAQRAQDFAPRFETMTERKRA